MDDMRALEHATLKVPYEVLNKRYRFAQKTIDKEIHALTLAVSKFDADSVDKPAVLDVIGSRIEQLKRKFDDVISDEVESANACKRRLDYLSESRKSSQSAASKFNQTRLDRMLVEYFLRTGYYKSASELATSAGIVGLTSVEMFVNASEIEKALLAGDAEPCLAWCQDNRPKLRKLQSGLEAGLRRQQFVKLVLAGRRLDAVLFARKHFAVMSVDETALRQFQKIMGLLAFQTNTETNAGPYGELVNPRSWNDLVSQFRRENFALYQLSSSPVFTVTLQAGLSALKTHQCSKEKQLDSRPSDCPVCCSPLSCLAASLPYSQSTHSRLRCYITGERMGEDGNRPMVLPNGHVYGLHALENMQAEHDKVTCPRTGDEFQLSQAERLFVMY